ncbi:alpha/beta hydrolase [Allokutzneria oryzae]|uniref:Alpha/beta hydrolase n=1 Tax=Allokutzneria oryzae TaxID=1378989 RepID=A0ABV6A796_9PSEU
MISVSDVRRWRQPALDSVFQALGSRRDTLVGFDDELNAAKSPAGWTGEAAQAAARHHGELTERMRRIVAGISAVRRAVGEAADAIKAIQRTLGDAEYLAGRHGFGIADDGKIIDVLCTPVAPGPAGEAQMRERATMRVELADRVEQVLRRARDVDTDLAAVLERAALDRIDDGCGSSLNDASIAGQAAGGLSTIEPPAGGSPADNAGWWSSLSESEQAAMLKAHPDWLGNLDGLPAVVRDQANRARLGTERTRLNAEAARLEAEISALGDRLTRSSNERTDLSIANALSAAKAELNTIRAELIPSLDAIDATLAKGDRQLLLLDTSGDKPKAAIAAGNVDTAEHVTVFTPGLGTTVRGDIQDYDRHMAQLRWQAEQEADASGRSTSVAAVTWIGYEAPQVSEITNPNRSVASDALAQRGAEKLAGFLNGIDASRPTDPHMTALGHSYGSLTTGLALQKGTGVDDAVFFGSPGLGTSHVEALKVPTGHSWVIEARMDPVADFAAFGIDPNQMKGIGGLSAKEVVLPDGRHLNESVGHGSVAEKVGYLAPGSTSQYNMSLIVAGLHDRSVRDRAIGAGDLLQTPIPGLY